MNSKSASVWSSGRRVWTFCMGLAAVTGMLAAPAVQGAAMYWDTDGATAGFQGGTANWNATTLKWTTNPAGLGTPVGWTSSSDDAVFNTLSSVTATIPSGGLSANSISQLGPSTLTLSGGILTPNAMVVNGATCILDYNNANTVTTSNLISNGTALSLGGGTLTMKARSAGGARSQSFSGLTVNAGGKSVLSLDNNSSGADTTFSVGPVTRNAGAILRLNYATGTSSGTGHLLLSSLNGNPNIRQLVTDSGNPGILEGSSTTAGQTDIGVIPCALFTSNSASQSFGTIDAAGARVLTGAEQSTVAASAGLLHWTSAQMNANVFFDTLAANATITLDSGTLVANSLVAKTTGNDINWAGPLKVTSGAVILQNGGKFGSASGSVLDLNAKDGFITLESTPTIQAKLTNTSTNGITFNGGATFTISSPLNDYTGRTTVGTGTLALGGHNAIPIGSVVHLASGTANLDVKNYTNQLGGLMGSGNVYHSTANTTQTVTLKVAANQSYEFNGMIKDNAAGLVTRLVMSDSGTQVLAGANTYSGGTTITGGALRANHDSALGGGLATVNGGTLEIAAGRTVSNAITLTSGTLRVNGTTQTGALTLGAGTVGGSGTVQQPMTIGAGLILSPGNGPGTLTTAAQTWAGGGAYRWEVDDATVSNKGMDPGYDWANINGMLTITATEINPFAIDLVSLLHPGHAAGEAANFDAGKSRTWTIATASGGIDGFAANKFQLVDLFANSGADAGRFSLVQAGNSINLAYTASASGMIVIMR